MSAKAFWMFKWQGPGSGHQYNGEFAKAFSRAKAFRSRGFASPLCSRLWRQLKKGDAVFCYQTSGREITGIAQVVKKGGESSGKLYVDLKPLKFFRAPIKIQLLKRTNGRLAAIGCLQSAPFQAVHRVSINDARVLAQSCQASSLVNRSKRRMRPIKAVESAKVVRSATSVIVSTTPKSCPLPAEPEGHRASQADAQIQNPLPVVTIDEVEVRDWVDRLLSRHDGDLNKARFEARLMSEDSPAKSKMKRLMERVAEEILQEPSARRIGPTDEKFSVNESVGQACPGSECSCGGKNKDCFRCSGSGIVEESVSTIRSIYIPAGVPEYPTPSSTAANHVATIHQSLKKDKLATLPCVSHQTLPPSFAKCPVCNCDVKRKNVAKHLLRVHMQTSTPFVPQHGL